MAHQWSPRTGAGGVPKQGNLLVLALCAGCCCLSGWMVHELRWDLNNMCGVASRGSWPACAQSSWALGA
jgi:hypothetical protein